MLIFGIFQNGIYSSLSDSVLKDGVSLMIILVKSLKLVDHVIRVDQKNVWRENLR